MDKVLVDALQYASYAVELTLIVVLFTRGRWKQYRSLAFYFLGYVALDTLFRPTVLYVYGFTSLQYRYVYWISDVVITLGAFILICLLFRRASLEKPEAWSFLRSMLGAIFVIIAFISYSSIASHYDHLFSRFIIDLQQNLYFACLVLNTLLYIMLLQWDSKDEQLSTLVCGLGIGFAGPAANMALMYLTPGGRDAGILLTLIIPLCSIAMCMVWLYALSSKVTENAPSKVSPALVPAHAHAQK